MALPSPGAGVKCLTPGGIRAPMSASALRRRIFEGFAATGEPPDVDGLEALVEEHIVVLRNGAIYMAHPFAAHHECARVDSGGRVWWGNCAWDGLGIVTALGLPSATVTAQGITIWVADGVVSGDAVFTVEVPASRWWDDIAYT